ncbi:hypothetical protein [Bacillus fonticola]|uniref:hypothetical protein n=1 Tax=Bacillus fonticola TaxID=2728853 RepID=UPI001475FCA2|nr:hypothetical protein [Bacillus fonticola]
MRTQRKQSPTNAKLESIDMHRFEQQANLTDFEFATEFGVSVREARNLRKKMRGNNS